MEARHPHILVDTAPLELIIQVVGAMGARARSYVIQEQEMLALMERTLDVL
jgi:hypothetical protein